VKARGKKLSNSGAKARLYHAVKDAHLAYILRVDLKNKLFAYEIDHNPLALNPGAPHHLFSMRVGENRPKAACCAIPVLRSDHHQRPDWPSCVNWPSGRFRSGAAVQMVGFSVRRITAPAKPGPPV